jgi:hypothetical protein
VKLNPSTFQATVTDILENKQVVPFLGCMAQNLSLSCTNLLLLYAQAKQIAEKSGGEVDLSNCRFASQTEWSHYGYSVKDDAPVYYLVSPYIYETDDGFVCDYRPAPVLPSTSLIPPDGETSEWKPELKDVGGKILGRTEKHIETASPDRVNSLVRAEYNKDDDVFYVASDLNENDAGKALISAYIIYMLEQNGINDSVIVQGVKYVVMAYFGQRDNSIREPLFGKWKEEEPEEVLKKLGFIRAYSFLAVQDLSTPLLSYDEAGLMNTTLSSDFETNDDYIDLLNDVLEDALSQKHELHTVVLELRRKLGLCDERTVEELVKKKEADGGFLYSYQPFQMRWAAI